MDGVRKDRYLTPHFRLSEMRCRCRRPECDAVEMQQPFMAMLERLRVDWAKVLLPTSGQRCKYWNEKISGSAKDSQHLLGNACDFYFINPVETRQFVQLAEKHGFGGIGHGNHKVHLDGRHGHFRWTYDD